MSYYETSRTTKSKLKSQTTKCQICLDTIFSHYKSIITECQHSFHIQCFNKLIINNEELPCPICRKNLLESININFNKSIRL